MTNPSENEREKIHNRISFLKEEISFIQISELVERVLNQTTVSGMMTLESILEADKVARHDAQIMAKGLNA